jgi:peptidoglycan/xylan/chitin deacetylase (PgdA/CDA1 family)
MLSNKAITLTYHRIYQPSSDVNFLCVSPKNFDSQCWWISRLIKKGSKIHITFDDGFADVLHNALPILKKYNLPATVYICTGKINSTEHYWWDALEKIIFKSSHFNSLSCPIMPSFNFLTPSPTPKERKELYWQLRHNLKHSVPSQQNKLLKQLSSWSGTSLQSDNSHRVLTLEELKALASDTLITIGAHTQNHPMLSLLSNEDQEEEILGSKNQLEKWLNKPIEDFSICYGSRKDFNHHTEAICHQHFRTTTTTIPDCSGLPTSFLPRRPVRDWGLAKFIAAVECYRKLGL